MTFEPNEEPSRARYSVSLIEYKILGVADRLCHVTVGIEIIFPFVYAALAFIQGIQ